MSDAASKFFRYFQHELTGLQEQMQRLQTYSTTGGERADAVDHCLAGIARLSSEVKNASSYLPAYDQRTYGEAVKALSNKLQESKAAFAPKPRFSFKSTPSFTARKNESAISLNDAVELAKQKRRQVPGYLDHASDESSLAGTPADVASPPPEGGEGEHAGGEEGGGGGAIETTDADLLSTTSSHVQQPSFSRSTSVSINNYEGLHIILPPSAGHATSSGTLSNLRRCVLDMSSPTATGRPFAGLTLRNVSESLVVCGHVDGAVHLTNIADSVIVVASRQFRMHDSRGCDVYLLTTGRPIIEDCAAIRFAPFPDPYMTAADGRVENQWQHVDDFKWLRAGPSPNWSLLEASERLDARVWSDVVPGGPGLSTADVLKAARIRK